MKLWAGLFVAVSVWAAGAPRIVYTKIFPGSVPAYSAVSVEKSGACEYKEAADDDRPLKFQLPPSQANEIFEMAEKLGRFQRPLESNLKVANMGTKIFRWEDGKEIHEVKFNYTQDLDAAQLYDWFERIVETEQHLINLERAVRFDKLGVNKALLLLETTWDRNRLVVPQQFLPLLDRVVKNESYLHMARERAAALADAFRGNAPKAAQ